jgi:type I restriction enzyme S subunit
MKRQRVRIDSLYRGLYDGPHATPKPSDGGPVFLGIGNITPDGQLDLSDIRHIAEEDFSDWTKRVVPQPGDIVFTYEATLNLYAIIPKGFRGCLGRRLALIRPDERKVNPRFLFFYFFSEDWRRTIGRNTLSGATVDRIPLTTFPSFEIDLPSRSTQDRIVSILSAYDDLIENNTRRIGILEQMAQMLYREWFVNFRFPGCEKLPFVGSVLGDIPEGWEIADLASVCVERNGIQTGPFGSQLHMADYSDEGVPVVMPKDLIGFRIRTNEIARIPESIAEKLSRHRMQLDDIVYGRRGDIGRRAYLMPGQAGWFCGTGCLRIRPNSKAVNSWYLFNYLGQEDVQGIITGRALGVTMPNLNTGVMASVPVKLPPRDLQDAFARITFPMAEAREVLTAAIENLRRTRDLLLPKLVSGEVSVEQLEAEVPALTV